jgi:anti-sigma regulatory factor (Ser/Thr protein kinase)
VPYRDDIVLAASELAANVIRHAKTRFTVRLSAVDEVIRLEVSDGSSIIPAIKDLAESYRGLRMIEAVSEQWGIETTETGKTIWAEFTNTP